MFHPNIIKLSQSYGGHHKISASGDISTSQNVRVVSLELGTPTGPNLCLYQILSKYFKPLRRYGVHSNSALKFIQSKNRKQQQQQQQQKQ